MYDNFNNFNMNGMNMYGQQMQQPVQQPSYPKFNKSYALQCVQNFLRQTYGIEVYNPTYIEECPQTVKHACLNGGIQQLPMMYINVPSDMGMVTINFYVCTYCAKLFIYWCY